MKSKIFNLTATVLMVGTAILPAAAAAPARHTSHNTGSRISSDTPEVRYLFRQTPDRPYDIQRLIWYGGLMERIVVVSKSRTPIMVHCEIAKLAKGIVVNPIGCSAIDKVCLPHKTTVIADMMSRDGKGTLSYTFTHDTRFQDIAIPGETARNSLPASPVRYAAGNMGGVL
jgi:hypothetical protein